MAYEVPSVDALDKWVNESVKQAQGKKQTKLANKFEAEYIRLKYYAHTLTEKLNNLNKKIEG